MYTEAIPVSRDAAIVTQKWAKPVFDTRFDTDKENVVSFPRPAIGRGRTDVDSSTRETVPLWTKREEAQITLEPVSDVAGTVLDLTDAGVFCEVYVGDKIKHVNMQRDLFPDGVAVGMPFFISMETSRGFRRFVVRERAPDPTRVRKGNKEIDDLISCL